MTNTYKNQIQIPDFWSIVFSKKAEPKKNFLSLDLKTGNTGFLTNFKRLCLKVGYPPKNIGIKSIAQ